MSKKHETNSLLLKAVVRNCQNCGAKKVYYFQREKIEDWKLKKFYIGRCPVCNREDQLERKIAYGTGKTI